MSTNNNPSEETREAGPPVSTAAAAGQYRLVIGELVRAGGAEFYSGEVKKIISEVPDVKDVSRINYWVDIPEGKVYIEGWSDDCIKYWGYPKRAEEGAYETFFEVGERLTPEIIERKAKEAAMELVEGGFIGTPNAKRLFGITYGVYKKPAIPKPTTIPEGYRIQQQVAGHFDIYRPDGKVVGTRPTMAGAVEYAKEYEEKSSKVAWATPSSDDASVLVEKLRAIGASPSVEWREWPSPAYYIETKALSPADWVKAKNIIAEFQAKAVQGGKMEEKIASIHVTVPKGTRVSIEEKEEANENKKLLLDILEHEVLGAGRVLNPARAAATPCKCVKYDTREFCWSPGVLGLISSEKNPEQLSQFCAIGKEYAEDGVTTRFGEVKAAIEEAHSEWERKGGGLPEWWSEVAKSLEKHGIEL